MTLAPATYPATHAEMLAREDPQRFLDMARSRCRNEIADYTCTFTKKERVGDELKGPYVMQVHTRSRPFSVMMTMSKKSKKIRRALYVEGSRFDRRGQEMMLVEPAGWRRLLASQAEIPVNDERILKYNRSTIDQFGFMAVLEDVHSVNARAEQAGVLDLQFEGRGQVDGRPTLVLTRRLPYTGDGCAYPDALTVMHLDEDWLVPVSIERFADVFRQRLLASYLLTRVRLNPGLNDGHFRF